MPVPTLAGMFLLCGGALVFELAFNKIVGVQGFGRLGDIAIGTALFGYALAGVLYVTVERVRRIPAAVLAPWACLATGLAMPLAHILTTWVPLDFAKFFEQTGATLLAVAVWYLALALPFFTSSLAIVSLLSAASANGRRVGKLYGADLVGAGCGAVFGIKALPVLGGAGILWFAGFLCAVAGACFAARTSRRAASVIATAAAALALGAIFVAPEIGIRVHAAKRDFLRDEREGNIVTSVWSAVSRIDVAKNKATYMIWFDGGSQQSLMRPPEDRLEESALAGFNASSTTLAYRLRQRENVLVLASSGGSQVRGALLFGARHVTAVEIDPAVCKLVRTTYDDWLGGMFNRPDVTLVNSEGRSFLRHSRELYDVIQIESAYSDAMLFTGAAGDYNTFLLTNEAIKEYWQHLTDDGVLWLGQAQPVRLFTQVLAALDELGVNPEGRIYYEKGHIGLGGNVLLLRKTPFPDEELEVLEQHVRRSKIEVYFAPWELWRRIGFKWHGRKPDPNLRTVLGEIYKRRGGERTEFLRSLPYEALPSTDDKPFYNRYFPFMSRIPDPQVVTGMPREMRFMANVGRKLGPVPISDVPPVVILVEAALLMLPVIVLPWATFRKRRKAAGGERPKGLGLELLYFSCVGLGFIAVEVVLARRFVLFFGSPTVALAVVLGGLLFFAGVGSALLSPLVSGKRYGALGAIAVLVGVLVVYAFGLDAIFAPLQGASPLSRYAAGVLVLMPLGLTMGIPFPAGLRQVARGGEGRVAWAWALNGYSSVVATASIGMGIHLFGYRALFFIAAATYLVAGLCYAGLAARMAAAEPAARPDARSARSVA